MTDLQFKDGRAAVQIEEGVVLSIITPERQEVLDAAKEWSPSYLLHGWDLPDTQCDEHTYEVAVRRERDGYEYTDSDYLPDEAWEPYSMDDEGDRIFAYIPRDLVHAFLDANNVKPVEGT